MLQHNKNIELIWTVLTRLSIKTIFINFKYLEFSKAIKFPILISRNVRLKEMKGEIIIDGNVTTGMILMGFGDIPIFDRSHSRFIWRVCGRVIFKGKTFMGHGTKISVEEKGTLIIGKMTNITAETTLITTNEIEIGNGSLISWNVLIMDSDFHSIRDLHTKVLLSNSKQIRIGNNVWIGCNTTILKGSIIPDNTIIGACSFVNKELYEGNCVYGGNPVSVKKNNVDWVE